MDEVETTDAENYAKRRDDVWNVAPPGGESLRDFTARVMEWHESVTRDTVVVAHGGVSRCLHTQLLDLPVNALLDLDAPQDKIMLIDSKAITWL